MSPTEVFLLVVRWLHLLAAAIWIGGSIFFLLVLRPAARRDPEQGRVVSKAAAGRFRSLVDLSIVVLVSTGAILTFNRLTGGTVGVAYVTTLAVKVALSVWMLLLVQAERRTSDVMRAYGVSPDRSGDTGGGVGGVGRRLKAALSGYSGITVIGIFVFLLSDALKTLFEIALRSE